MVAVGKLHDAIKKSGFGVPDLARKICISKSSLYRKLSGETNFSVREANAIKKELRMSNARAREIFFNNTPKQDGQSVNHTMQRR